MTRNGHKKVEWNYGELLVTIPARRAVAVFDVCMIYRILLLAWVSVFICITPSPSLHLHLVPVLILVNSIITHSGIYVHSPEQKEIAMKSMKAEQVCEAGNLFICVCVNEHHHI